MASEFVSPQFFTRQRQQHDELDSEEDAYRSSPLTRGSPSRQETSLVAQRAAGDTSLQLRDVLATYNSHATCALQATRGLKHYIAKLEELIGECGVPESWEVSGAAA